MLVLASFDGIFYIHLTDGCRKFVWEKLQVMECLINFAKAFYFVQQKLGKKSLFAMKNFKVVNAKTEILYFFNKILLFTLLTNLHIVESS